MKKLFLVTVVILLAPSLLHTYPSVSVFPPGTTVFHPDKTWSGYTVFDPPGEGGTTRRGNNTMALPRGPGPTIVPRELRLIRSGSPSL